MPCAAVQQLPHLRRGACDWTVGGPGGREALVPFCDLRWQCSLCKNYIIFYLEKCDYFLKIKLSKFFNFTLSFDKKS
jgi:hypothetical protein